MLVKVAFMRLLIILMRKDSGIECDLMKVDGLQLYYLYI